MANGGLEGGIRPRMNAFFISVKNAFHCVGQSVKPRQLRGAIASNPQFRADRYIRNAQWVSGRQAALSRAAGFDDSNYLRDCHSRTGKHSTFRNPVLVMLPLQRQQERGIPSDSGLIKSVTEPHRQHAAESHSATRNQQDTRPRRRRPQTAQMGMTSPNDCDD